MIDTLTNLIKTQNTTFTKTLDRQQVTINNLQTELEHTTRDYSRKIDAVINQGSDNFALLDEKLDNLGGKLLRTTIDMMTQAEAKISEMGMDKEALGKLVDRLAEKAFEKNAELANGNRRKKEGRKQKPQLQPKTTAI